jgi:hypothetical protein
MCRTWQVALFLVNNALVTSASHGSAESRSSVAIEHRTMDSLLDARAAMRRLQTANTVSASNPTINEVDNAVFSRPPYSKEETSSIVYGVTASIGLICIIILLVAANLDSGERRRRRARAIVPEESVPCAVAEQYYIDEHLITLRSSQDFEARKKRMGFCSFAMHYGTGFFDALARQHLCLSLFVKAIPTFTRLKRGILIVVQLHVCMLASALAYNVLEHDKPNGKYEMFICEGQISTSSCTATLPLSLLTAVAAYPFFRFMAVRQMRLTCFVSQFHPSSSQFPLNVRKFARIPAKSAWESLFCMRNAYERRQVLVIQSRSLAHRVVHMLWKTTQPSIKDLRFYGVLTSWCLLLSMLAFVGFTITYVILFTAYLKDEVVYHWLSWTLIMFFSSIFILEPLQIFVVEVFWCAFVANFAQRWGFGAHALAGTTRYKEVVRQIEQSFIKTLRRVAAARLQRWWCAVLDMYQAINEQTSIAVNFQAITKKTIHSMKYAKERKWCLKVEVQECYDLEQVLLENLMSPMIRLQCDVGNPTVMETRVAWDAHRRASFNETFFVDIKESQAMYVSVWSKTPTSDEFVGRGYFEFGQLKSGDRENSEGQDLKVTLHDLQHGEARTRMNKVRGCVNLRVKFLDPSRELCGDSVDGDDTAWMLPKHRMQFALSKMGGRMKVSKMLGGLGAPLSAPVSVKVPAGPMRLDTATNWQVGGPRIGTAGSNPHSPTGSHARNPTSNPNSRPITGAIQPAGPPIGAFVTGGSETVPSGRAAGATTADPLPPPASPPPDVVVGISLNSAADTGAAADAAKAPKNQVPSAQSLPGQPDEGIVLEDV